MKQKDWESLLSGVSDLCSVKAALKANHLTTNEINEIKEILEGKYCFVPDVDAGVISIPMFDQAQISGICDEVLAKTE